MARLPVEFFDPSAKRQLLDLPSRELKRRALELLAELSKKNPKLGKPCGFAFSTGNLSDCRKLYLTSSGTWTLGTGLSTAFSQTRTVQRKLR